MTLAIAKPLSLHRYSPASTSPVNPTSQRCTLTVSAGLVSPPSIVGKIFRSVASKGDWVAPNGLKVLITRTWPIKSFEAASPTSHALSINPTLDSRLRLKKLWAWPYKTVVSFGQKSGGIRLVDYEFANHITSLPNPIIPENSLHLISINWVCVVSFKIFDGFIGAYNLRILSYLFCFCAKNLSVGSPCLVSVSFFSSTEESILRPCLLSIKGDVFSGLLPSYCFSVFASLSSCVAVCMGPEDAIENTSVFLVGEGWISTSHHVTILQLSDFVVKAPLTHLSFVLNSMSSSKEDLSDVVLHVIVLWVFFQRGWKIPSCIVSKLV